MGDEIIDTLYYIWCGHNRSNISTRAIQGSGGVEIIASFLNYQYKYWMIPVQEFIGFSCFTAMHVVYSVHVYVPPSSSSHGDISVKFLDYLKGYQSLSFNVMVECSLELDHSQM